ncbi:MAG: hypothetical protein EXR62_11180 [Chloroflexi bacterium]|nr:hypothetical protein [Chloroflexota bacterium]
MLHNRRWQLLLGLLAVTGLLVLVAACGATPTPEVRTVEKVVTQMVTQIVEKEKVVQQTVVVVVKETVQVQVEKPVVVTATPAPTPKDAEKSSTQHLRLVFEGGMGNGPVPGLDIGAAALPVQMFLPLFLLDSGGKLIPGLATKFEANADNTVFKVFIDPKATWSDGKTITAKDIVDWYNWVYHPSHVSLAATTYGSVKGMTDYLDKKADKIEGFKVLDDKTLEITLAAPQGWFPFQMAYVWAAPARVEQFAAATTKEEITAVWLKTKAKDLIVSGPFKPTYLEPEPAAIYTWVQNPKWWGDKKPIIQSIEGTTIRDFQTMLLLFENGEVDAALQLSGPPAVLLQKSKPDVFKQSPAFAYFAQFFNTTKAPTDDINLRKALLFAIDWQKVADVSWEGQMIATNGGSLLPPTMPCYDASYAPYKLDVAKAKDFLSKSKFPTGDKVPKIRVLTAGSDPPRIRAAQIIQEMWRTNLGIENVEIKNAETEFQDGQGLVNVRVASGGASLPIPALILNGAAGSKGSANQFTQYSNPDMDKQISAVLSMDTKDPKYCGEFQKVMTQIQDQALIMPTAYIRSYYQVQPWLKGFDRSPSGWYTTMDTYLAKR